MSFTSYRDLRVWQLGIEITSEIYRLTDTFPRTEVFGLSSQLRRAAVSIPSNIAEGHARNSTRNFLRFLSIALGSVAEVETQLIIAENLGFACDGNDQGLRCKLDEEGKMLRGLQRTLQSRISK